VSTSLWNFQSPQDNSSELCFKESSLYPNSYYSYYREYHKALSVFLSYTSPLVWKYIPVVESPPNHTSLPSTAATFLATLLIAVLQPSGYSVFHGRDTPIQLCLPWRSYSCQCLNTETSTQGNRGFTNETPSISYIISLYIRLVVIL